MVCIQKLISVDMTRFENEVKSYCKSRTNLNQRLAACSEFDELGRRGVGWGWRREMNGLHSKADIS